MAMGGKGVWVGVTEDGGNPTTVCVARTKAVTVGTVRASPSVLVRGNTVFVDGGDVLVGGITV